MPSALCAFVFARAVLAPVSAFAADNKEAEIEKAGREYSANIEELIEKNKNKVSTELQEKVRAAGKANVQSADAAVDRAAAKKQNDEKIAELERAKVAAEKKENSAENKMLGGLSMAATGIGGMQLAQGLSEMQSDNEAAADMAAYLKTIKCGIGGAKNVKYNEHGAAPAETRQLGDARMKYVAIAKKMKMAKENLGMAPGIESDLIIDTSALYQDRGTDQDGITHHFDTATERLDSGSGKKRAIAGGVAAGAGVLGGVVGNAMINKDGPLGGLMGGDKKEGAELSSPVTSAVYNLFPGDRPAAHKAMDKLTGDKYFMGMSEKDQLDYIGKKGQSVYQP